MDKTVQEFYGNRVRTRVCGLCWEGDNLLLVNHYGLYNHDFWAPPGGGLEFGKSAQSNLEREFLEETGLVVTAGDFQFACELIKEPFHAIELFFAVAVKSGLLLSGKDPEMSEKEQVIAEVKYLSIAEINQMPEKNKHGLFKQAKTIEKITSMRGYLKI